MHAGWWALAVGIGVGVGHLLRSTMVATESMPLDSLLVFALRTPVTQRI